MRFAVSLLAAQMRLVKNLDDDTIGIRAVERCAAISMIFKWMDDLYLFCTKFVFQFFYRFNSIDNEPKMIQMLSRG